MKNLYYYIRLLGGNSIPFNRHMPTLNSYALYMMSLIGQVVVADVYNEMLAIAQRLGDTTMQVWRMNLKSGDYQLVKYSGVHTTDWGEVDKTYERYLVIVHDLSEEGCDLFPNAHKEV